MITDNLPELGFSKGYINNETQIIEVAIETKVVTTSGSFYSYGDVKAQGKPKFIQAILDAGLLSEIEEKTRAACLTSR